MEDIRKKAIRQRLVRQGKTEYANRYGMSPKQIHKALSQTREQQKEGNKRSLVARSQAKRPQRVVRKKKPSATTLFEIPTVTTQLAVQYPTPDWFTSTEKAEVTVVVPCYKSASVLKDLIGKWSLDEGLRVEVIFVDDNCPASSKEHIVRLWEQRKPELKKPVGKVFYSSQNQGFATSCNIGGYKASGDYIIFLNADTVVTTGWIMPIARLLRKKEVGIVGNMQIKHSGVWKDTIDSAGSQWSWETMSFEHVGRHIYNGQRIPRPFSLDNAPRDLFEVGEREMVTGCCIAMRKEVFLELGGFNPNYRIGYWEDSEICMAAKEKGYKIMYTPHSKIYHKGHHAGAGGHKYADHNIMYFKNKWINTGRLDEMVTTPRPGDPPVINNIIIKRSTAHGDVLTAAAVCPALKKKYPDCHITFNTVCQDVIEGNPYIDKVVTSYEMSERKFDLYFNLDMAYEYRPHTNILEAYADVVGVKIDNCKLYVPTEEPPIKLPDSYIVLHAGKTRWPGRDWSQHKFEVLASKLSAEGHTVVAVGTNRDNPITTDINLRGRTTIPQLAHVIENADLLIGIDSFPMHIAQAVKAPAVCFFGAVDPKTRLIGDTVTPVVANGLGCLGCHHRQPVPCTQLLHCETVTQDCINMVSVENMMVKVKEALG